MATGMSPVPYLSELKDATDAASAHRRLSVRHSRITWDWPFDGDLGKMFWPVVPAAIELLMSPALANLKVCHGCGWLFLDSSKNRSRKWCRMSDCGNLAKVRSHRKRDKAQEQ
jgi:predicted RNA-binding Zn ribbon-like protein